MQIAKAPWGAHTIQNKISGTTRTCSEIVCNGWFKEGSNRTSKMWLFYYHFILTAQVRIISPKGHVYKMSENSYPQLVCLTKNNGLHLSGGLRVPLWCQDRAVNEEQKTTLNKLHRKLPQAVVKSLFDLYTPGWKRSVKACKQTLQQKVFINSKMIKDSYINLPLGLVSFSYYIPN